MPVSNPLWPAQLDHFRLDSDVPQALCAFYCQALGLEASPQADGTTLLDGPGRRLLIGTGRRGEQPFIAFRLPNTSQLAALAARLTDRGLELLPSPTPLFQVGALAVRDPDGRQVVFGLPRPHLSPGGRPTSLGVLPGRLQHVVVASQNLGPMLRFYEHGLGMVVSDTVREEDGTPTVGFLRTDPEHHSFAVFRAPQSRPDHHSYECTCWNDIRDWADHLAGLRIPLWWGPGRHGPGNNLFFMFQDPQGYLIELSAELEVVPDEVRGRFWKHEERTLNLWGPGFMRS